MPTGFIDVSGDGTISPIDALIVINLLNNLPGNPEGEGGPLFGSSEAFATTRQQVTTFSYADNSTLAESKLGNRNDAALRFDDKHEHEHVHSSDLDRHLRICDRIENDDFDELIDALASDIAVSWEWLGDQE